MKSLPVILAGVAAVAALAGCGPSGGHASGAASSAQAAVGSVTANPQVHYEIDQAKDAVKTCFAGTPLQQVHQVHLVFLSSASGKNGPAVTAARDKTFTCLGIPASQRTAFKNAAITAAEHGKVYTRAGAVTYLTVTLPQLVLKYRNAGAAPDPGTTPNIPGATTAPAATASAS